MQQLGVSGPSPRVIELISGNWQLEEQKGKQLSTRLLCDANAVNLEAKARKIPYV